MTDHTSAEQKAREMLEQTRDELADARSSLDVAYAKVRGMSAELSRADAMIDEMRESLDIAYFKGLADGRAERNRQNLREQEPVAWATHHDEPLFFPSEKEACKYCDDDEMPIPIYAAPMPPSVPDAHELWAAAQLTPGESIEEGVGRIESILAAAPKPGDE